MKDVIEKLNNSKSIAILTHIVEDGDAVGSAMAMACALRKIGKQAIIYASARIDENLSFLGDDYVVYSPENLAEHDLCLCLDCGDEKRLGDRAKLLSDINNSINIDHHYTNTKYADVNYVEGNASSTGEIVYKLLRKMDVAIDKEIAFYLYSAICSDTGSFKYSCTSSDTMRIAAELMEYDIDFSDIAKKLFDTYTLEQMHFRAELMLSAQTFYYGRISIVAFEEELFKKYGILEEDIPSVVDIPRGIDGVEIAIALKRINGEVRASLRSNSDANVSDIAKHFGGGGHIKAAGFRVRNASLEEVKQKVIEISQKALEKKYEWNNCNRQTTGQNFS